MADGGADMANTKAPRTTAGKTKAARNAAAKRPSASKVPASADKQPLVMRPTVPASYGFPTGPKGLLDWSWARERLTKSQNYVIVTVRPDGRPHAMGMHGLWWDDAYYFGTSADTRKAKNLETNSRCILVSEDFNELIIVEGVAENVGFKQLPAGLSEASKKKYGWPIDPRMGGTVYKVAPRVVFAFPLKQITTAVTKWVFNDR
jgi:hypothetical protein